MPDIIIKRIKATQRATLGTLRMPDGLKLCNTLERGPGEGGVTNRRGQDRIPAGEYRLELRTVGGFHDRYLERYGPLFHKGMVQIANVPDRDYILFHIGNYFTDSLGCVLLGQTSFVDGDGELAVGKSRDAYVQNYPILMDIAERGGSLLIRDEND
jgi:hypothetical protein